MKAHVPNIPTIPRKVTTNATFPQEHLLKSCQPIGVAPNAVPKKISLKNLKTKTQEQKIAYNNVGSIKTGHEYRVVGVKLVQDV
jgi:hypothetical protein